MLGSCHGKYNYVSGIMWRGLVRDVWHWRWNDLLERVQHLSELHQQGLMSEPEHDEFVTVLRMLVDGRAFIEALGCEAPPEVCELSHIDYALAR